MTETPIFEDFSGMDREDMTISQRTNCELRDINSILSEMLAVVEGGECREDFETLPASHHLEEIVDFLQHRQQRVQESARSSTSLARILDLLEKPLDD